VNREPRRRPRVGIAHVRLGWGGSEKRVMWGIEALKEKYDVTLLTAGSFDLASFNRYYGTNLAASDFAVRQAPLPAFLRRRNDMAALRGAVFQRFCRRVAMEYDLVISAYGPTDFGRPGIHFIADFSWCDRIRESLHPYPPGTIYRKGVWRAAYLGAARRIARPSGRDLFSGEDTIVAVSPWVARVMGEEFGVECRILESPVHAEVPVDSNVVKRSGFVCLGRIAPEKRIERIVEIVGLVRDLGHDVTLHIIGECEHSRYAEEIDRLCARKGDWVVREGRLAGVEKARVLAENAFGLHACEGDAFPGAVVEMMKAGCITWVHNSGGQVDIVNHSGLAYANVEEAVKKIGRVLKDQAYRAELMAHVQEEARRFSVEAFMEGFRSLVAEGLDRMQVH